MRGEEAMEEDGKRDRGEIRGAIAGWTPEGRVYFNTRYHRRRCYRRCYHSAPHALNGQQMDVCVRLLRACIEMIAVAAVSYTACPR